MSIAELSLIYNASLDLEKKLYLFDNRIGVLFCHSIILKWVSLILFSVTDRLRPLEFNIICLTRFFLIC